MSPIRSALEINTGPPFWISQGSNTRYKTSTYIWPILRPFTIFLASKVLFYPFILPSRIYFFPFLSRFQEKRDAYRCLLSYPLFPSSSPESAASACSWRWSKFLSVCKSKTMFIKHLLLSSAPALGNHDSALYM